MANWLRCFITTFRKESESLSPDEKSRISNLNNFFAPLQVLVLWFPDANVQYVICTHDDDRSDLEIGIEGPIPLYEAVDKMESILKDARFNKPLPEKEKERFPGTNTFSDFLESLFVGIVQELKNLAFEKPVDQGFSSGRMLTWTSFVWTIRGDLAEIDKVEMTNRILKSAKDASEKAKVEPTVTQQPMPRIKGCSTFFYPQIWVGKLPKKTFKERVYSAYPFPAKVMDLKYKEKLVTINQNGLIAIGEENVPKALRMFNEIMATFLLYGLDTNAVREIEVGQATIDPVSLTLSSYGTRADTPRTRVGLPFSAETPYIWPPIVEIEKEQFSKIIQQAERISGDPDISDFLIFLLESRTHLKNSEYNQSFIMSWVIVERQMSWIWQKFLREEGIGGERRKKLTNPAYATMDFILEALSLKGLLSQNDYQDLMSLKNKRNDIIHSGEFVTLQEAEKCFGLAEKIVKQKSGIL